MERVSGAETQLTSACVSKVEADIETAKFRTLRIAANACWHIHHFADLLFCRVNMRPADRGEIHAYIKDVQSRHCRHRETGEELNDLVLLGDVADALKHAMLSRRSALVSNTNEVMVVHRGYGTGSYGTGKFGGVPQVWIILQDARRPLLTVLRNALVAWKAELSPYLI